VEGTKGAEILDDLYIKGAPIVEKTRYSGFYNTNLEKLISDEGKGNTEDIEVHVVGVCTNICVMYTVEELRNRDIKTIVHKKGVASFDEEAHKFALTQMKDVLGAEVI
jgi:nicotinamidase/pyrazinamidase